MEAAEPREDDDARSKPEAVSLPVLITSVPAWVSEHVALVVTIGASLIVGGKIAITADFNPQTAVELVRSSGTSTILLGTLVQVGPSFVLVPAVCVICIALATDRWLLPPFVPATIAALLMLGVPFYATVIAVLVVVGFGLFRLWGGRWGGVTISGPNVLAYASLAVAGVVWFGDPWLPTERVTYTNGSSTVEYVVARDGADVVLLSASGDRTIRHVPAADVKQRDLCEEGGIWSWRFRDLFEEPAYPDC